MLTFAIETGFVLIGLAMTLNLWRLVRGPDATDRILALDTMTINAIALLVLFGVRAGSIGAVLAGRRMESAPAEPGAVSRPAAQNCSRSRAASHVKAR